ncbi:MAG: ABC transporter ATP-binding protein/permease [Treponema sp.]|jgi:ATP-binding cassette subfamily B protein|nr:ABC transporter ATP-binding protein/permease [Treponema sp.]
MSGKTTRADHTGHAKHTNHDSHAGHANSAGHAGHINYAKSLFSIFAGYYRPHWKLFAADMFCASLISASDLAFPMLTRFALDRFLSAGAFRFFFMLIIAMFLLYLFRMAFTWFVTYWGHTVGAYIEADMRRDLFSRLQQLPFSFYDTNRTGQLMARVTTDLFDVTELAHHGPEDLFISFLTLAGSLALVFTMRWEMALVLLLIVPFMLCFVLLSRRDMKKASAAVKEKTAGIIAELESSISGARVSKAFTNEGYEKAKFGGGNENYKKARKEFYKTMANFHSKIEFMTHILQVIIIGTGGLLIMQGKMNMTDLITCSLFVSAFLQPVRRLQNFVEQFTTGMAGFRRFVEIMRIEPDIRDRPGAKELENVRGDIEYRGVSFAYKSAGPASSGPAAAGENGTGSAAEGGAKDGQEAGRPYILNNISLSIPAGSTLALVGPSGGGKTTLCHLLPRFYEILEGSITIDGQDIRDLTLESLRRNIGIVQQDVFLFAGTIRENIAYGKIGAGEEEIIAAAGQAEIHDEIEKMSSGYDTVVGERGITLSGGQKQRVSIARIFLKNPPILILDEATSALDSATELRIQGALEKLSRGRTTVVIAHRLSTIRNAGAIAVINDEGIAERGTHGELMAKDGLYARLYRSQFGGLTQ